MIHHPQKLKRFFWMRFVFVLLIGAGFVGGMFFKVQHVFAEGLSPEDAALLADINAQQACLDAISGPVPAAVPRCPPEIVKEHLVQVKEFNKSVRKPIYTQALVSVISYVTDRLAYEAALYIANGGVGEGSMFYNKSSSQAWKDYGKEVAGEAFAALNDVLQAALNTDFNLCSPPDPMIQLNLKIGIKQQYVKKPPRCNFDDVTKRWGDVWQSATDVLGSPDEVNHFLMEKLSSALDPSRNELGASIKLNFKVNEAVAETRRTKFQEQLSNDFKPVRDAVTGYIKTTASDVSASFKEAMARLGSFDNNINARDFLLAPDITVPVLMSAGGVFINTLGSQYLIKLKKGLIETTPDSDVSFNFESAPLGKSTKDTEKSLAGVFSTTPISITEYSALGEFVTCPPGNTSNRGLNQCVIDTPFMTALTRAGSGKPLTIKEAMDQKLLKGDWPLIPPSNLPANQDRLCYSYAYCYGNLVKLRKARVLPVGWEIAAEKNTSTQPKTLNEIMGAFNNCNDQGIVDSTHPWCHLIDPNWILRAPESQCRANVNGEISLSTTLPSRQTVCADAPTCVGEDNNGKCAQGFGYCVEEKNIWRVSGDVCPAEYASCFSFKNTSNNEASAYLLNTVNASVCSKQNAGCAWYRTQKFPNASGYDWNSGYQSTDNRLYLTHNAKACAQDQAGCTELNVKDNNLTLNLVQNGSFETDEDKDGVADSWEIGSNTKPVFDNKAQAVDGNTSVEIKTELIKQTISVSSGDFYTASVNAFSDVTGFVDVALFPLKADGTNIVLADLQGLSYSKETCMLAGNHYNFGANNKLDQVYNADGWKRFSCTISIPKNATQVEIVFGFNKGSNDIRYDAVQIESGELATTFSDGYNTSSPTKSYLKLAPSYLNCKGLPTDSKECTQYAQVCAAQDVGCNSYTPVDSGPAVPAVTSALDQCPNECVGYETFKQEATPYESAKFPVHFIGNKASVCTEEAVGCDGFTKLASTAGGGETQAYFTNVRACMTPGMATATPQTTSATFFTWEGSDNAGYQLQTWQLLQANPATAPQNFIDKNSTLAPCTKWQVTENDQLQCAEDNASLQLVAADKTCQQHADIFTNPDCREFFDVSGNVHYRLYSKTVSVDKACEAYRKDKSTQTDCQDSGGLWTSQGFCRYFGLAKESQSCNAASNGCRAYTNGAGRNTNTIFDETFESGTTGNFKADTKVTLSPSNDSVATGGHSLSVKNTDKNNLWSFAFGQETNTNGNVCQTDGGCKLTTCTVEKGKTSCGPITDSFVKGKIYTMQFWAKGTGALQIALKNNKDKYDFIDPANKDGDINKFKSISLTNTWQLYSVGPLDTGEDRFKNFDQNSIPVFILEKGMEMNIDNITLTQSAGHVTVIKDSWVVPAVCDQSPNGIASPQYYLGCKAYTDRKSVAGSYYQFSRICSEKAVGCSAFYNTSNSDSAYASVNNARCVNIGGLVTNNPTACKIAEKEYCTISIGSDYCVFNAKNNFPVLPSNNDFKIEFGSETVVTPQDQSIYAVDNGNATCSEAFKGCREVGKPTFSQDLSTVTAFASEYKIDNPNDYQNILCEDKALFCEEYSTTKDGNYYFKNPLNKTCEYKTSVNVGGTGNSGVSTTGWFRSGTDTPCDPKYIASGDQAGIWKSGDKAYAGWVGACKDEADRCTEFLDTTDISEENHGAGKAYYVINNDKLLDKSVTDSERCNNQVSQRAGCALFDNSTISQLKYNASASYALSLHADDLLNKAPNILVDPIDCSSDKGGTFNISSNTAKKIGSVGATSVDLCNRRCNYELKPNDEIISAQAQPFNFLALTKNGWVERSCLVASDCPVLSTKLGEKVTATCLDLSAVVNAGQPQLRLKNDTNTIIKVNRDRTCSAWLACDSSRSSWDSSQNKYVKVCDSVSMCTKGGEHEDCQNWTARDPVVFTNALYSARDVSWAGNDYSGYTIPNQLPVERYTQFNLSPQKWCADTHNLCDADANCKPSTCVTPEPDYRLVYNAGPCALKQGADCRVGFCADSKLVCAINLDCPGSKCVIGYCQASSTTSCTQKSDCSNAKSGNIDTKVCDQVQGVCVDKLLSDTTKQTCSGNADCIGTQKCVTAVTTSKGVCYNNRCLTDIKDANSDGFADKLDVQNENNTQSCRGYPEIDSPFPQQVVKKWKTTPKDQDDDNILDNAKDKVVDQTSTLDQHTPWSVPFEYAPGYDKANVCSPDPVTGELSDACLCSYKKIEYGKGLEKKYYSEKPPEGIPNGICTSGLKIGVGCTKDDDCKIEDKNPGTCSKLTSDTTVKGWTGYCLEKDTSIQINSSTDPKDRACLTWLPVDQLSGATDLYGQNVGAGYSSDENTFYCAEPMLTWDLYTSTANDACAETPDWACNDWNDDKAWTDVVCPIGFFGVIKNMCGGDSECGQSTGYDSDYPYFCVPKGSIVSSDSKIAGVDVKEGDLCLTPPDLASKYNNYIQSGKDPDYTKKSGGRDGIDVYGLSGGDFVASKEYYQTCAVKGVSKETTQKVYGFTDGNPYSYPSSNGANDGYRDLSFANDKYHVSCKTLVQVGSKSPDLGNKNYNAAWTNRVWQDTKNTFSIKNDNEADKLHFAFTAFTDISVFGQTIDVLGSDYTSQTDKVPVNILMCRDKTTGIEILPNADGTCSDPDNKKIKQDSNEARSYGIVSLIVVPPQGGEDDCKFDQECNKNIECLFDQVTVESNNTCNNKGGTCNDKLNCVIPKIGNEKEDTYLGNICKTANTDGKGICNGGGDYEEKACATNYDCWALTCNVDISSMEPKKTTKYYCGAKNNYTTVTNNIEVKVDEVKKRLQQTFAQGYKGLAFGDGITIDWFNDQKGDYGKYDSNGSSWLWDIRATGDGVKKPTPPIVISVGNCTDTKCAEKNPGKFSINGQDEKDILGTGSKRVDATFFVKADPDQMPVRNIVMDWGDSRDDWSGTNWPIGKPSGSTALDNYYKNQRGYFGQSSKCNGLDFGTSDQACDTSYILFNHDYACSKNDVYKLEQGGRECGKDGKTFYPCVEKGACVYRPRVHVLDNWGWCTGTCDVGNVDKTNGCFNSGVQATNECDIGECPGKGCGVSQTNNPWINYAGEIKIKPE